MVHLVLHILLVTSLYVLSSCDSASDVKLSQAANCFTLNFYKVLRKDVKSFVSSPFSLDVLLSLLRVGAGGNTQNELTSALQYDNLTVEDMVDSVQVKLDRLTSSNGNTLEVANSIWIQDGFNVEQNFKDVATTNFYAMLSNLDFMRNASQATKTINDWGKVRTHDLIPVLFDQNLDPNTVTVLVNAIYFKGEWQYKFQTKNTQPGSFYNNESNKNPTRVQLMNQKASFKYNEDNDLKVQVLEMDYTGKDMSMVLILPQAGSSLESVENSLTCGTLRNVISSTYETQVDVTLPKFELESKFDLMQPMKDVGIKEVLTAGANFSGIAPGIAVSKAIQKAVIKVYEEGSEAAALTGVVMTKSASFKPESQTFRADRPFIYLIRDKRADLILFMGRVKELPNSS